MSKLSTLSIQERLVELGESIGLRAEKEYSFPRTNGYNPRYDVIWFIDVESLHIANLKGVELIDKKWLHFASFEVEGSTTSSKNQVGNVGNLFISPCQYHFMIVANREAGKENDTYRRGVKIVRTMQELMGNKNIIFLDASMLPEQIPNHTNLLTKPEPKIRVKGSGGETISLPIVEKVIKVLSQTNLTVHLDYASDYFKINFQNKRLNLISNDFTYDPLSFERKKIKGVSHYYYCPKVDISTGFFVSGGFLDFLKHIGQNLREDKQLYPLLEYVSDGNRVQEIYYPLLGIEIETDESKHAIGGLVNAGRLHQIGWLVGTDSMVNSVETYQYYLGLRNTHYISINQLDQVLT